ncbi:hypothetical protein ACFL1Q_00410 [Patescibacteria group bacterium]
MRKRSARKIQKKKSFNLLKVIIPLVLLITIFLFWFFSPKHWNGKDKLSLVIGGGGDIKVSVFDPVNSEITSFIIPADTQVTVAEGKGIFKIKNVWQLGIDEHLGGKLLAETVTNNFNFPVYLWKGEGKTNMSLVDSILLSFFKMSVKEVDKNEIDLGKSLYVKKQKLEDGEWGYVLNGTIPERLTVYFSDYTIAENTPRVLIEDATGKIGISEKMGEIIEIMGGKIVSVQKKPNNDTNCTIGGGKKEVVEKFATIFSCQKSKDQGEFDVTIKIGRAFAKRF